MPLSELLSAEAGVGREGEGISSSVKQGSESKPVGELILGAAWDGLTGLSGMGVAERTDEGVLSLIRGSACFLHFRGSLARLRSRFSQP